MCGSGNRGRPITDLRKIEENEEIKNVRKSIEESSIDELQEQITQEFNLVKDELPFKYLGVPLTTKKMSINQYQGLIKRIMSRITCWSAKMLSYAGRIQLIKAVIFGIQAYWSQIFVLPKKVVKAIENACRIFLWTGKANPTKRALVAWEKICLPKSARGWNIFSLSNWNKAAISKQLWNIANKTDKFWVKWIHGYYIKQQDIITMKIPNQASWIVRKILAAKEYLNQTRTGAQLLHQNKFSIQQMYCEFRGTREKVEWRKILCNNFAPPKCIFICWLAMLGRLATCDRLIKMKIEVEPTCSLCKQAEETMNHLFFECEYSADIWRQLTTWSSHTRHALTWEEERNYVIIQSSTKNKCQKMYRMVLSVAIYFIWQERNKRKFQRKELTKEQVLRKAQIQIVIICQGKEEMLRLIPY